nr:hypothetical protein [Tanacetum cinerariifolium]
MSLSALLGLNLSNNHLNGGIPDIIGNMKALNSLDFSVNQLTGPIPTSIAALNFLSHLNLSNNNFSGRIPTGNQLQTLMDPSIYVGNRDLCGFWGFIGLLLLKKDWRHKLYWFSEDIMDKIYVAVVLRFDKMKRGRARIRIVHLGLQKSTL